MSMSVPSTAWSPSTQNGHSLLPVQRDDAEMNPILQLNTSIYNQIRNVADQKPKGRQFQATFRAKPRILDSEVSGTLISQCNLNLGTFDLEIFQFLQSEPVPINTILIS